MGCSACPGILASGKNVVAVHGKVHRDRRTAPSAVIAASQRVGAKRRPMTGSAKQSAPSTSLRAQRSNPFHSGADGRDGLLRCARNDVDTFLDSNLNSRCASAFSRHDPPEVCLSLSLKHEGAGNAGCALHPRSRVQNARVKTHTSIQGSGEHPTFPAQWLYGLSRAHPGVSGSSRLRRLRIAGSPAGRADLPSADLTPTIEASGPHDFAVRFGTARLHVPKTAHGVYPALQSHRAHDAAASTAIPSQRSVTMANAPSSETGWHES
jgi:hypothetical protein